MIYFIDPPIFINSPELAVIKIPHDIVCNVDNIESGLCITFSPETTIEVWQKKRIKSNFVVTDIPEYNAPFEWHLFVAAMTIANKVFVPSDFAKEEILSRLLYTNGEYEVQQFASKMLNSGNAIQIIQDKTETKDGTVNFPYLPTIENGIEKLVFLSLACFAQFTVDLSNLNKEYCIGSALSNHPILIKNNPQKLSEASFMVSFLEDQVWDNKVAMACMLGCTPLVPDSGCYPEMLEGDEICIYHSMEDLFQKIQTGITQHPKVLRKYMETYIQTPLRWIV